MGSQYVRFFRAYRTARERLVALALAGLRRLGVEPNPYPYWQRVGGDWAYLTDQQAIRIERGASDLEQAVQRIGAELQDSAKRHSRLNVQVETPEGRVSLRDKIGPL